MRKAPHLPTSVGGASRGVLSDIFKKFHPRASSGLRHRFFAIAPGWHYANQFSPDLRYFESVVALWSTSSIRPPFSLSRSLLRRHLLTPTRPRSCISRDGTPSNLSKCYKPVVSRGKTGGGYRNGTRFRPFQRELSSSKPISADNLFLSGLQFTHVPHEWDFGWIELETSIPGRENSGFRAAKSNYFTTIRRAYKQVQVEAIRYKPSFNVCIKLYFPILFIYAYYKRFLKY